MWDYWEKNSDKNLALDLEHYDAIGRMVSALSRHADEVYQELPDEEHRLLCMKPVSYTHLTLPTNREV